MKKITNFASLNSKVMTTFKTLLRSVFPCESEASHLASRVNCLYYRYRQHFSKDEFFDLLQDSILYSLQYNSQPTQGRVYTKLKMLMYDSLRHKGRITITSLDEITEVSD